MRTVRKQKHTQPCAGRAVSSHVWFIRYIISHNHLLFVIVLSPFVCSIPITYPDTWRIIYYLCARRSSKPYLLRSERHRHRGVFHPNLPVPPSRTTRWYVWRRMKWVCGLDCVAKQGQCVIYFFGRSIPLSRPDSAGLTVFVLTGVNHESSFESTLLQRVTSCEVWGYDYSINRVSALPPYYP